METINSKKLKNMNKITTKFLNFSELDAAMIKTAKKHIPKKLSISETLYLLQQSGYSLSEKKLWELVIQFSIPVKKIKENLFFDRDGLMKWFRCDGSTIPTLEMELMRATLKIKYHPKHKK
ncbi:MAG: hypothetical protein ABI308_02825 [Mucilaginibacter sp.]